jgi:hypothetical protein
MHATRDCGLHHGRRGLAAEPWPWQVLGGIPRERNRRDGSSEPDGRAPGVLVAVENAVKVEPVGEFELKGIRCPLAAYNVVGAAP